MNIRLLPRRVRPGTRTVRAQNAPRRGGYRGRLAAAETAGYERGSATAVALVKELTEHYSARARQAYWDGYADALQDTAPGLVDNDDWRADPPHEPEPVEAVPAPPCPVWCRVDHAAVYVDYIHECASRPDGVATLAGSTMSAEVIRLFDVVSGREHALEIRVGDECLTPVAARALLAQLEGAITLAEAGR